MACPKLFEAAQAADAKSRGVAEAEQVRPVGPTEAARKKRLKAAEVDCRLRKALRELQLAERNAVLWFAEVLERRLFRELGFSSIYQYAGEALSFSRPRTAQFIRLCESLKELPALRQSVAAGEVSWTKAREVAKVATPQTESAWVDLARQESRRKLERRVRLTQTRSRARRRDGGRQLGLDDAPAQPACDDARTTCEDTRPACDDARPESGDAQPACGDARPESGDARLLQSDVALAEVPVTLSLRFTPEQYARYEAILEKLRKRGERAAREELVLAGLEALLAEVDPGGADPGSSREAQSPCAHDAGSDSARESTPPSVQNAVAASPRGATPVSPRNIKPVYQIVVQQCEDCGRAHVQTSRGAKPIAPTAAEAMRCDARILRRGGRNRATIPPAVRREVLARDEYRCRAPGCGSARFLEVHHVVPREKGGSNRPDNLVTLCSACHRLAHTFGKPG